VDFSYLEGFVGGEVSIALEVVALFRQQAPIWLAGLEAGNPDFRAVAHTGKGAALGIGAKALAEVCQTAEFGGPEDLAAVRAALAVVVADIVAYETAKAAG